jgi:hypothetical protein
MHSYIRVKREGLQGVKVYYLSPIYLQNISPGQIPVIPAKVNSTTGT